MNIAAEAREEYWAVFKEGQADIGSKLDSKDKRVFDIAWAAALAVSAWQDSTAFKALRIEDL